MNLFKRYYCSTYNDSYQPYLLIHRRKKGIDARVTSFHIKMWDYNAYIKIRYHAQWDTYAPLIIEYCINDLKVNTIELADVYEPE